MSVKVASPSPTLEARMQGLSLGSQTVTNPVPTPASRTAPAVQKVYSQADFERENTAFEKIYTATPRYDVPKMHFSETVYDIADGRKEPCLWRHKHPEYQQISIVLTHETIRVLNQLFRNPIRSLGKTPSPPQVQVIYDKIMNLPSFTGRNKYEALNRVDLRKRVYNLVDAFYRSETVKFGEMFVKLGKSASLKDVVPMLFNPSESIAADLKSLNPKGSFAEAIGCEVMEQAAKTKESSKY